MALIPSFFVINGYETLVHTKHRQATCCMILDLPSTKLKSKVVFKNLGASAAVEATSHCIQSIVLFSL